MAVILLTLGVFLIYPVFLIFLTSFMTQPEVFAGPREWGLDHWIKGFEDPRILRALWNTFLVWGLTMIISLPVSIAIAWTLARTRIPYSHAIEFVFWVAYMTPGGVIAWILLADPQIGILNVVLRQVFTDLSDGPFNIFSLWGIVWVNLMGNGIALKVMLLTPAFRNMDVSLEEAARVGGSSSIRTMFRITLPLMIAPIAMVFALQLVKIFQSFETELLLGTPWGFYVYSTLIYELVRTAEPPLYGEAAVLASLTLLIIAIIIPFQKWILSRREYATLTGSYKPGLMDLGRWKWVVFTLLALLHFVLTGVQIASLVLGSFMTRSGYFQLDPIFSLEHWQFVFNESLFLTALKTTLALATATAVVSPVLFAVLAYILVRTHWPGRPVLDTIIWSSAAVPGMLSGLGLLMLFIGTPRADLSLWDDLGNAHCRDSAGQGDGGQHSQGEPRPSWQGHGGGGSRVRRRLDEDVLSNMDTLVDADAYPDRDIQLCHSSQYHGRHHPAGVAGDDHPIHTGATICVAYQ